jgi:hypothetical protein
MSFFGLETTKEEKPMRAHTHLFGWILLAGLAYAGPATEADALWKQAGADDGLRQAFERVVYQLKDSAPGRFQGANPANRLELEFSSDETRLKHPQGDTVLRLTGYGYGARLRTPLEGKPTVSGNRVEYQRGEINEWYVNDSRGLEQGFTLARRPGVSKDGEPLVIALGVSGGLRPELTGQGNAVLLQSGNNTVLRYDGLLAWDARGRALSAKLEVGEREVRLVVDDRGAEYPVVVDPVWAQESELLASDAAVGDNFGWSVSVSGSIAVIGAYTKKIGTNTSQGAAYVFTRSGTTWTQQQELTASDGAAGDWFGYSVSLSGTTVVIGAPQKNVGSNVSQGAAYVFALAGSAWSQMQELTTPFSGNFGWSVALDGSTALIGASGSTVNMNPNQGFAYVYVRSGSTWGQQQQLAASDGVTSDQFGYSVAVSGNTAVVSAANKKVGANASQGAAYVFTRSGSSWTQQQKLTSSDGAANDEFGYSVSLSGSTALIGAPFKKVGTNTSQGAAYVFAGSGSTWSQQQELVSSDGAAGDEFGYSVAVTGSRVLVGAVFKTINSANDQGAAYVFVGSGTTWTQQQELTASDGTSQNWFGSAVSLNGTTALIGATWRLSTTGAAYVFNTPYVVNDFAGDGLSGVVLYDPSIGQSFTALSKGDGTYSYVPSVFSPSFNFLRTGDYNGDGRADLIVYNSPSALAYIGLGNGDGTFSFQSLFWSPGYTNVLTGDIDGDGKTDIALYNSSTGTMYAAISNGDGTFSYTYTLISANFTYLKLADFNGDGKADIFAYNATTGLSYLGIGSGTGTFTFYPLTIAPGYNLVDVGDLNGDGKADVILYNSTTGTAETGISNLSNGFNFTSFVFSPGFTSVRLGNFTGNGLASVTLYNSSTALAYFGTGTGTGTFNFQSLFWSPGYDNIVAEDVNGDGKTDIVLYNSTTGTAYTGLSSGGGTFTYTYQYWGIGKVLAQF